MTDSKTVVEDLAAWLTGVWDEEERVADEADGDDYYLDDGAATGRFLERITPASVLARIAADRLILEIHSPDPRDPDVCTTCGEPLEYTVSWPCETARALASPYADRPGFRKEWL